MSFLPAPKHQYGVLEEDEPDQELEQGQVSSVPPLGMRIGYKPSRPEDFGDGGAFPEIHMVQYPRDMGRPGSKSTAIVAVDVDEKGEVRYDAIVKQGSNKNKLMQTSLDDIKEKAGDLNKLALPDQDEEAATAEKTRLALESLLNSKIKKAKPTAALQAASNSGKDNPTYIRYTPNPNAPINTEASKQRVIRMVEAQIDPIEPSKHMQKKLPGGPPSPPAPVLHSPPRKLTVADQAAWKIPPCISNWKNARGYTIPLDKRLAADGRGLQETTINNKFASFSEALYVVERKAAEDIRVRNQVRKQIALQEKGDKEKELREMAVRARMERAGVVAEEDPKDYYRSNSATAGQKYEPGGGDDRDRSRTDEDRYGNSTAVFETEDEAMARKQRESLRDERRRERERELRKDGKKKTDREADRDVSEKIALGVLKGGSQLTGEGMFDSRLFNQSSGMDSGFGAEDEYNTYTKSLFVQSEVGNSIYRPKASDTDTYGDADAQLEKLSNTSKFKADKGFKGTEAYASTGPRSDPVQFEAAGDNLSSNSRDRGWAEDNEPSGSSNKRSRYE